jgi:teichuronic acid biosynthesis glycosyltransferase TuaC
LGKTILAHGLMGRVSLLGRRDPADVARWLCASDLLCLPSHSEGCPNVVIEALCCGRPVVASAVGGIPEVVDRTCGILVPPKQPDALAAALEECLATNWNERQIAERYERTWDDVAQDTLNLLGAPKFQTTSAKVWT